MATKKQEIVYLLQTPKYEFEGIDSNSAVLIDSSDISPDESAVVIHADDQTVCEEIVLQSDGTVYEIIESNCDVESMEIETTNESSTNFINFEQPPPEIIVKQEFGAKHKIPPAIIGPLPSDNNRLGCRFCGLDFRTPLLRRSHERNVHNLQEYSQGQYKGKYIQCLECDINFMTLKHLRLHLNNEHSLKMTEEEHEFCSMDDFNCWKKVIERRTLSKYLLKRSRKTMSATIHSYICHRSGVSSRPPQTCDKRKRIARVQGSVKLGMACTSELEVTQTPEKIFLRYFPNHYGHGNQTSLFHLSEEEHTAIKETLDDGLEYDDILADFRKTSFTKDYFQMHIVKGKDRKYIENAFQRCATVCSDNDQVCLARWIKECSSLDHSPILYCSWEQIGPGFTLVVMSEFQKHIITNASKQLICVDNHARRSGSQIHLNVAYVVDKSDDIFPVAFCVSYKATKDVIHQFFTSIKEAVGQLTFTYFVSAADKMYFNVWKDVMKSEPKWLFNQWDIAEKIRRKMRPLEGKNARRRNEIFQTLSKLMSCRNVRVFDKMLNNFTESLRDDKLTTYLGQFVEVNLCSNTQFWAYCHRKDIPPVVNTHLEVMHQVFNFWRKMSGGYKVYKSIYVLMMVLKNKIIEQILKLQDKSSIETIEHLMQESHQLGMSIPSNCISLVGDKVWSVRATECTTIAYVTQEYSSCPEACHLKCGKCDVCIHMLSCSCAENLINANMCQHIHAVACTILLPNSQTEESKECDEDDPVSFEEKIKPDSADLVEDAMLDARLLCETLGQNKSKFSDSAIKAIRQKLKECSDICKIVIAPVSAIAIPSSLQKLQAPSHSILETNQVADKNSSQPILLRIG